MMSRRLDELMGRLRDQESLDESRSMTPLGDFEWHLHQQLASMAGVSSKELSWLFTGKQTEALAKKVWPMLERELKSLVPEIKRKYKERMKRK